MTLLFVFIFISIFVSFLCSILEAVVLSITPSYLASIEKTNEKLFKKLSPLLLNIERPLAAILSLNTFAHTIGATGAGAQVQKVFGDSVLTIFSIVLTFAILFLSEIIPKSIGARHWKKLIPFIGYILPTFIFLTLPLVWLSESISKAIKGEHEKLTRDEIHAVAEIGVRDGAIFPEEFEALKNMLSFPKKPIKDITLPIEKVFTLPLSTSKEEFLNICEQYKFSRIPIVGNYEYDVRGYVLRSEILSSLVTNEEVRLPELLKPMLQVTDDTKIRNVFTKLIKRKEHIASVHSEGGDLVGIVTLEDIIEEILGLDIRDETDN